MARVLLIAAGLLGLATAGCGGPARIEDSFTCVNGDRLAFSPDGFVTYQGRYGGGREHAYVIDGDAVRLLRHEDRDPVGDNIYLEFAQDDDRLVSVRKGERNESFFCQKGDEKPQAPAPTPTPTQAFIQRERPGTEVAEVLGLRLGDPLEDVRRKLSTNADPFRELNQTMVSENPEVFEKIHFTRTPQPGASASDSVMVYFSPPPQRLVVLERSWMDGKNPIPWQKMLAPAIQRYGQPVVIFQRADTWFLNERNRPIEPPPDGSRCSDNLAGAVSSVESSSALPNCGRVLQYNSLDRDRAPVSSFSIMLYDPNAIAGARKGWAAAAQQESERKAQEKLDAAKVPDQ